MNPDLVVVFIVGGFVAFVVYIIIKSNIDAAKEEREKEKHA